MSEKVYSRVTEAEEIVKSLCTKYPEVLWCVSNPEIVAVMGIENKERSEKNKTLAKIKPIKGSEKAILQINNIPVRYIIELYWNDFREWKERKKQWIIFHELLHIHHEIGKTIKHDSEDFRILLDRVGVNWVNSETLPDLINDKVEFNLELRPSLEDMDEGEETDNIEDDEDNKAKKKAKKDKEEAKKTEAKKEEPEVKEVKKDDGDVF
jgi:predicted metallopeptidase